MAGGGATATPQQTWLTTDGKAIPWKFAIAVSHMGTLENDPERIEEGLRRIRRIRSTAWLAFAAAMPSFVLAGLLFVVTAWLFGFSEGTRKYLGGVMIGGPPFAFSLFSWLSLLRANYLDCPRCGKWFHRKSSLSGDPWTRHCVHCCLPLDPNPPTNVRRIE